jgi:hypothetical protein
MTIFNLKIFSLWFKKNYIIKFYLQEYFENRGHILRRLNAASMSRGGIFWMGLLKCPCYLKMVVVKTS